VVGNAELAARLERTAEWIEQSSGIRERRYASIEEDVVSMAVRAGQDCLRRTGVDATAIGLLIVASGSGASGFPGPAASVATGLGLGSTPAMDVPVASAGSVFALALAMRLADAHGNVLVIASEKMSALIGDDPNTAMLFGDGAGAALVSSEPGPLRLVDAALHSDGQYREDLAFDGTLKMNGLNVILHASRKMPAVIEEVLQRNQMTAAHVQTFLLHQANLNLLTRVAKTLNVERDRVFTNIERYGNTSSASLLIAAAECNPTEGPVVFCAFGAGFHWGAVLARSA
jgi:3-oxoacyl-[acyl-carrier-protein] synthase-3